MLVLAKIQSWLLQPKVCKFVCFVSSVVGLLCYAFSSSFTDLFGKWNWWKLLLYIIFSFIVTIGVSLAKAWEGELSTSVMLKAHTAILVLLTTSVYSFFFDKEVKRKPDIYNLVSCVAFSIMSLGLSTLSHFGFELDLLYFFNGVLIVQLMKIKVWLVIVGGSFSYSIVILRSTLNRGSGRGFAELRVQDEDYTLIDVESLEHVVTEIVWFSRGSSPSVTIKAGFMGCIDALKKENENVISTISKHVDKYLKANFLCEDQSLVPTLQHDDNLMMDVLPPGIVEDLHQSIKQMVLEGFKNECLQVYTNCRREFLKESLSTFGLQYQELNMEDIDKKEKIESWIKAVNVAVRLLFPNEMKLCNCLFRGSISSREFAFTEVCTELATSLLSTANALAKWSNFIPNTFQELLQEFKSLLLSEHCKSLRNNAMDLIARRSAIFEALGNASLFNQKEEKAYGISYTGELHPTTFDVITYVGLVSSGGLSLPVYVVRMTELLERRLEAYSKNYHNPTLGYVFLMNNWRFIVRNAKQRRLGPIFGDDWLLKSATKFQHNLKLYQSSSWNKILDFLKLDIIHESEPNVVGELMKDKLFWFNEHFAEICNVQSAWSVCDVQLRREIIESTESMLLPAYGKFLGRFQEILGKQAYEHIKYGMLDVQDRLNNLFLLQNKRFIIDLE